MLGRLVCIIDDDAPFRAGISRLLRLREYDVAEYGSAADFLGALQAGTEPDCVLLDIKMPGLSGPRLQEHLLQLGSDFPIIFLTGYGDIPTTVKAIKSGAEDVLTKPVCEKVLTEAIGQAIANFRTQQSKHAQLKAARTLLDTLTPREREVFEHVVRGKMNKETAHDLGIAERTIKAHRHRIVEKLGTKTIAELVSMAEKLGLLAETGRSD